MEQQRPNFLSGPYIDRRSEARDDEHWLEAARADPATGYLVGRGSAQLLRVGTEPAIAFLDQAHPLVRDAQPEQLVLLGWFGGRRVLLLDLPPQSEPQLAPELRFAELRPLAPLLDGSEAALLAYARALGHWRARHRFCGACAAPTVPTHAGHCLKCTRCGTEFFPRIDPAIIVLVSDGERALLGRQPSWPPRRYSTIAGFVEPGESLEDAVAREVLEETGVAVREVRYHSSQPWPFPSSLMLGFLASAAPGSAVRVGGELEDARWLTREQVTSGEILPPPPQSISWRLVESWLKGTG
ncbi:MAG TPA: NAD(+) diphosphatase [Steroidobacteraceae bacterium]|nr:NAD(+) diphosphatase [Steroidobacteraceae bacterium]